MNETNILVVSDLDGTLTKEPSSWQYVLEKLNLWENKGENNLQMFLNNEIDYDQFINLDVKLLEGIRKEQYYAIIKSIAFREGLVALFDYFKTINSTNIILSSGLQDLADRLSESVKISEIYANKIHKNEHFLTGSYDKIVGWNDKSKIFKQIKKSNPYSFIIAFGDTSADLPIIEQSDLGFSCFSNSEKLNKTADFELTDLRDAIKIIQNTIGK